MKILGGVLAALIVLIQYPLWAGKGGWIHAWEAEQKLAAQRARNQQLELRDASLEAEVKDLKHGTDAIEERARYELGMVKKDEVFFQVAEPPARKQ